MNELFLFSFLLFISWDEALAIHVLAERKEKTQKQPFTYVLQNKCSQSFCKVLWKIPVSGSHFLINFIKKETLTWKFSYKVCEIFNDNLLYRTPLVLNICFQIRYKKAATESCSAKCILRCVFADNQSQNIWD